MLFGTFFLKISSKLDFIITIRQLLKLFLYSVGVAPCSKRSMDWLLTKEGTGNAVVLVVGGASEALEARPGSFTLTIANRRGFSRIALKHG